ncbi:MAG: cysteine desulfurase [Planctomycetes bacterium]|nr:cysteine desulfurase [Planctomycetota bacterium]
MRSRPIYMDHHATTPVDPRVLDAMLPYFTEKFGNAASVNHLYGWEAYDAVEAARGQVASLLNASPREVIFTSGATEANNLALKGVMRASRPGSHLVTAAAEHRAVLDPARRLQRDGYQVTVLSVDEHGRVDPEQVAAAIRPNTVLVSIMLANNEVGTINPISEIGRVCRAKQVTLHCDAAQAAGRIPIDLQTLPVDLLSLSAHKLYGPKGVGALIVRKGAGRVRIEPLLDGGGHENRLRSGTLPVPLVVGFGRACELAAAALPEEATRLAWLRDRLWTGLSAQLDGIRMNGHPTERLPGNLNVSFEGVQGDALMAQLKGVAVSSGSACTTAEPEPSHVLRAMGLSETLSRASVRFGLGRGNTEQEVDAVIDEVAQAVRKLRRITRFGP